MATLKIRDKNGNVQEVPVIKGDKGPKGDKGEQGIQGVAGKDAITDQTYDPNSPNAQSGKAVNQALSVFEEIPIENVSIFSPYDYEIIYDSSHNAIYEVTNIEQTSEWTWLDIGIGTLNFYGPPYIYPFVAVGTKIYIEFGNQEAFDAYQLNKVVIVRDKFVAEKDLAEKTSETWDTIYDLELGEDAVVQISVDYENWQPINLKKFKILVEMPTVTSATTLWLKINNILAMFTQPSSASRTPAYSINGEYTYEWQLSTCTHSANAFSSSPIYTTPYGHRFAGGSIPFPCESIGLALNSAFTQGLPTGARVRIWGVKA